MSLLFMALAFITVYMTVVWLLALRLDNYAVVDVAWSLGFAFVAALYQLLGHNQSGKGQVMAALVMIWSLRLTWHLASRFRTVFPQEDPRYAAMRAKLGQSVAAKMLLIYLFQGLIIIVMTLPMAIVTADATTNLGALNIIAASLWFLSLIGESIADMQLTKFSKNKNNKGLTCQDGLWHYSRHPNYFFEWLGSASMALFAGNCPYGLWAWVSPAVVLYILLRVTGVKPSEEHSLETRRDYPEYMRTTSQFIPWFRREAK